MEYRFLGRSGLKVSVLGFGAMTFGGQGYFASLGSTKSAEADHIIGATLDAGVNFFDTADAYSAGESEEILGAALKTRRHQAIIATKVFARTGAGPNELGLSRHHIVRSCEQSLRRLGTDYIDLYQSHGHDALTPMDETLAAFDALIRAGKVRYVGCCNHTGWQGMKALAASDRLGLERYVSQQIMYSLMCRDAERELAPLGLDQGMGIIAYSPLAGGLLSGKYRRGAAPEGTRIAELGIENYAPYTDYERLYRIVDELDRIAASQDASPAQVSLAWVLAKPCVSTAIFGARNQDQLGENLRAMELKLSADDIAALDQASATPLPYPYWHQQKYGAERNPV